ncbi:hypothetical protein [Amorphus orientalis]|uniref:BMFP domain-containing protein YqiC n=1 Tax=Amorphus orientalis TaxID=649198 RepID=A0AAE4ARM3_9HYPH|nr:hypothetical protein [Amorphus orientalis]MDQ0315296.1 BMFP domain-containing protein YqiC [Amorphus orientalis]
MFTRSVLLAALVGVVATPVLAQDDGPANNGRYSLQEVRAGYLRLDRQSGGVSLCRERGDTWACELVADDRSALSDEIDRLSDENAGLRQRVEALEARLAAVSELARRPVDSEVAPGPTAETAPGDGARALAEEDLDQALDMTEQVMRRFFGMIQDLKRDLEESQPNQ